jgi:hypothetical protein
LQYHLDLFNLGRDSASIFTRSDLKHDYKGLHRMS